MRDCCLSISRKNTVARQTYWFIGHLLSNGEWYVRILCIPKCRICPWRTLFTLDKMGMASLFVRERQVLVPKNDRGITRIRKVFVNVKTVCSNRTETVAFVLTNCVLVGLRKSVQKSCTKCFCIICKDASNTTNRCINGTGSEDFSGTMLAQVLNKLQFKKIDTTIPKDTSSAD